MEPSSLSPIDSTLSKIVGDKDAIAKRRIKKNIMIRKCLDEGIKQQKGYMDGRRDVLGYISVFKQR